MNAMDRVPVNVHIFHYSKTTMPTLPPIWSDSPQAKFNIYAAVSEAAHRMRGLEYQPQNTGAAAASAPVTARFSAVPAVPGGNK